MILTTDAGDKLHLLSINVSDPRDRTIGLVHKAKFIPAAGGEKWRDVKCFICEECATFVHQHGWSLFKQGIQMPFPKCIIHLANNGLAGSNAV